MSAIERIRVRMYNVGFGDCFLVSFFYDGDVAYDGKFDRDGNPLAPRAERHLLMDFGSMAGAKADDMAAVAERIAEDCNGQLDVVAASHRHKDHLSGFALADAAPVIDSLNPLLVVRPWTEDPAAAEDATAPGSARLVRGLRSGEEFLELLAAKTAGNRAGSLRGDLHLAATEQLRNREAIANLEAWGALQDEEFLHFGMVSKIEDYIPGSSVTVIGPPTVEQYGEVTGQAADDPEYWMLRRAFDPDFWQTHRRDLAAVVEAVGLERDVPELLDGIDPGPVRWLVERMRDQHVQTLARIVRELDDALNNTSLILLIDAGVGSNRKRMLFGGDAQIENWRFALDVAAAPAAPSAAECRQLLRDVDLYKVGHHGSRNASPRTLVGLWDGKRRTDMIGLMSTMSCFHGKQESTRVPRQTLVDALAANMRLFTTDHRWFELDDRDPLDFVEVEADVTVPGPFKLRRGLAGLIKENDVQIDCGNRGH